MSGWVGGDRGGSLLSRMYGRCAVGLPPTPHVHGVPAVGRAEGTARSPARALWRRHSSPACSLCRQSLSPSRSGDDGSAEAPWGRLGCTCSLTGSPVAPLAPSGERAPGAVGGVPGGDCVPLLQQTAARTCGARPRAGYQQSGRFLAYIPCPLTSLLPLAGPPLVCIPAVGAPHSFSPPTSLRPLRSCTTCSALPPLDGDQPLA